MEGTENMEGVMAIGVGYVVILTPAIIVFWSCAPNKMPSKSDWIPWYRCLEFRVRPSV